jgi:hypothetical protein
MYYLLYKITNLVNNKIYIGVHKTKNINDSYMGSGIGIKQAIKKYGINNFKKEILKICKTEKEMFNIEASIVNKEFVSRSDTYNQKIGGFGGFDHIHKNIDSYRKIFSESGKKGFKKMREVIKKRCKEDPEYEAYLKEKRKNGFKGKTHSEETKRKIGLKSKINQSGEKNSQFGTCWIYNLSLKENKKIKKEELTYYLNNNWIKGRKIFSIK